MRLGIHVQRNRAPLRDVQRSRHIQTGSGFAYATLLIKYGDNRHLISLPKLIGQLQAT